MISVTKYNWNEVHWTRLAKVSEILTKLHVQKPTTMGRTICNLYPCMYITISLHGSLHGLLQHLCLRMSIQYMCLCVSTRFIWCFVYKFAIRLTVPRSLHECSTKWYSGPHIPSLLSGIHWTLNVSLARTMYIHAYVTVNCSAHTNVWRNHRVTCM